MTTKHLVFLILGPTGSGVSTALRQFEAVGYLPVGPASAQVVLQSLPALVSDTKTSTPVVVGMHLVPHASVPSLEAEIRAIQQAHSELAIVFLDAPEACLVRRALDADTPHPFDIGLGLQAAIQKEKPLFQILKTQLKTVIPRHYAIDTSALSPQELGYKIAKILGVPVENSEFTVLLTSFGFKHGVPQDSELVFDMRFINNPFYIESLRPLSGLDQPVKDYIFSFPESTVFLNQWTALMGTLLPLYRQQGKTRVSVAIGCTGGQHRSVCLTESLGIYLKEAFPAYNVIIRHRERDAWNRH